MLLTELLYCTSMITLCARCLDNFWEIFAKLIVEKKFRHENSVTISTSSVCSSPLGRMRDFVTKCRVGLRSSSGRRGGGGLREKLSWQYRKKL